MGLSNVMQMFISELAASITPWAARRSEIGGLMRLLVKKVFAERYTEWRTLFLGASGSDSGAFSSRTLGGYWRRVKQPRVQGFVNHEQGRTAQSIQVPQFVECWCGKETLTEGRARVTCVHCGRDLVSTYG